MPLSTRTLLRALAEANPDRRITEDLLRGTLRRHPDLTPGKFAGRLTWRREDVIALAHLLALRVPEAQFGTGGGL